jgi:release factor glutamine methyltransferase
MKLKEVLDRTIQFFKEKSVEKNIDTPRLDAEILLAEAMGFKNRVDLYLKFDQPLKDDELNRSRDFVRRRIQGEPVAYIIGHKDFFGFSFSVSPAVLIPRPETELLVEEALSWIQKHNLTEPKVLDLGCGSGCIGLSILKKIPGARLIAVDKSEEALEIARKNANQLEVADRAQFISSDVNSLNLEKHGFDLIIANPPYIAENDPEVQTEVKKFEPHMALFSGGNGAEALKTWSEKSIPWMKETAWMGFEMGWTQSEMMTEQFNHLTLKNVKVIKDLSGLNRHIVGEKNG